MVTERHYQVVEGQFHVAFRLNLTIAAVQTQTDRLQIREHPQILTGIGDGYLESGSGCIQNIQRPL